MINSPLEFQAMTKVYGKCNEEIGAFNDTKYIVGMLDRVCHISLSTIILNITWSPVKLSQLVFVAHRPQINWSAIISYSF